MIQTIELLTGHYRGTARGLTPEKAEILRQHSKSPVISTEILGRFFGVHRSTVSQWYMVLKIKNPSVVDMRNLQPAKEQ